MTIEVTNTSGQLVPTAEMTSLMTHAMTALDLNPDCDLNIAFVEDDYMTELHIKWMDEPGTTDVLSFPMDMPEEPGEAVTLGDIVISPVVAAAQALTQGHSTEHEISSWLHMDCFTLLVTTMQTKPKKKLCLNYRKK